MNTNRKAAWFQPTVEEYVAAFRGKHAEDFCDLFAGRKWWTVGEMCELLRISWLNFRRNVGVEGMDFDILPRRAQYSIVRRIVRDRTKWDRCLGSDDGREVLVFRLI